MWKFHPGRRGWKRPYKGKNEIIRLGNRASPLTGITHLHINRTLIYVTSIPAGSGCRICQSRGSCLKRSTIILLDKVDTEGGKPENPEKNRRSTGETNYNNTTHMSSKLFFENLHEAIPRCMDIPSAASMNSCFWMNYIFSYCYFNSISVMAKVTVCDETIQHRI